MRTQTAEIYKNEYFKTGQKPEKVTCELLDMQEVEWHTKNAWLIWVEKTNSAVKRRFIYCAGLFHQLKRKDRHTWMVID